MLGAILGDIVGSRFEFHNYLSKDFEFIAKGCTFTDDTVMTCAVAQALMDSNEERSCHAGDWTSVSPLRIRRPLYQLDVL